MRTRSVLVALLLWSAAGCAGTSGDVLAAADGAVDLSGADEASPHPDLSSDASPHPDGGAPVATIAHPADGSVYAAGAQIPFVGSASDPQDGALTGAALVWSSDLSGMIGTGSSLMAALPAGSHTITLTATDSLGLTGSASVKVTVN